MTACLACKQPALDVKEWLKGQIIESIAFAHEHGIDKKEITQWKWPY